MRAIETIENTKTKENALNEDWEEEFFWAIDGLLSKACPYLFTFAVLYTIAHILYRVFGAWLK